MAPMPTPSIEPAEQRLLLGIARRSIAAALTGRDDDALAIAEQCQVLQQHLANFVTLTLHDRLRGCIGTLAPEGSLADSVSRNAYRAAFNDPRFEPLDELELPRVRIALSVLGQAEPLTVASEAALCRVLRPQRDGLIIELGEQRATFLPSVWEALSDPSEFVTQLKRKAGLPAGSWSAQLRVWRYQVQYFSEVGSSSSVDLA